MRPSLPRSTLADLFARSHPAIRAGTDPADLPSSIAAVVATLDSSGRTYRAQVRGQTGRQVIIADLKGELLPLIFHLARLTLAPFAEMVERQLRTWIAGSKNFKPESILFFRDGVGEGQFGPVVDGEVSAIKGE